MEEKSILIIEEDLDLRNLFRLILDQIGVYKNSISFNSNYVEAREYLNQTTQIPKLIFLDLDLKTNDGLPFLREIKNNPKFKNIAITAISADNSTKNEEESLTLGANFIKKPFKIDEIKDKVLDANL